MNKKILLTTAIAALLLPSTLNAVQQEPYSASRILWDMSSKEQIFTYGNYSRVIQLQDGRLLAVAEKGNGIAANFSSDYGSSWSGEKIIAPNDNIPYAVPDVIQLQDGTILVGFNPRPSSPYSEDRLFGIRCVISYDNAQTWTDPIYIFDAKHTFNDGCWEPQFIELPSGEIHCYFANENDYTSSSEQCISMCRSFDKGLTWSEPVKVSFRAGSRDGMPVGIITDAGEIVVIIEDNGWSGYSSFRATTVRCSLEDNWSSTVLAGSPNREMIFENADDKKYLSAAPYLRKLHTGETIASWQGTHNGRPSGYLNMFVAVGDADARNFKHVTEPFVRSSTEHALWNSVSVIGDESVLAIGSLGGASASNSIWMMKGWPKQYFEANYGTPTIDGVNTGTSKYTYKNSRQVYMGQYTGTRATADFLWDENYLYFTAMVSDSNVFTDLVDNDGVTLAIDTKGACDQYPQDGVYKMFFNANGTVTDFKAGDNNRWVSSDTPEGINYVIKTKSSYYTIEAAIPWSVLGHTSAPIDNEMRVNVEVVNRHEADIETEKLPETVTKSSYTWFAFKLNPNPDSGIEDVANDTSTVNAIVSGNTLHVSSNTDIASVTLYAINGVMLHQADNCGTTYDIAIPETGIGILHVQLADGTVTSKKIAF